MEKENLNVQLSREDKKLFADYCQRHGVTLSDRVRQLIEDDINEQRECEKILQTVQIVGTDELQRFIDRLKEMGGV